MAKILGESGRYVSNEAARQRGRILLTAFVIIALLGVSEGVVLSSYIPLGWLTGWGKSAILLAAIVGIWAIDKWGNRRLTIIERRKANMVRGATGEIQVGNLLNSLPEEFCVINDLTTSNGNIDHVIVGPTGVFILDTKAWRGIVAADGKGELLLNEKPTDKPYVRQFVGRMMGVREKVIALVPGMDERFNAVFVFTAARVEAKWGSTRHLNCVTDDQLYNYIVGKDFGEKLKPEDVNQIAQAFLGLALMDKEFERGTKAQVSTSSIHR